MAFDGTDIDIDGVQHTTNQIGHGHQTMNDQAHSQYNRSVSMGQTTFAGRVGQAQLGSTDMINSNHSSQIVPMREMAVDGLRMVTATNQEASATATSQLSQPASGIGALINPGS